MVGKRVLETILFVFFTAHSTCGSRKYDIESECLKLYSEDLHTVLRRFRNTPDYLKILDDWNSDYHTYIGDMKNQITYHFLQQQHMKVKKILGIKDDGENKHTDARTGGAIRNARRSDDNKTKIERLDSYKKLSSPLNVAQRNAMRDVGFTYAGHIIHALVKNMGGGDDEAWSTQGNGQEPVETSTAHVKEHTVSVFANTEGAHAAATEEAYNTVEHSTIPPKSRQKLRYKKDHKVHKDNT